LIFVLQGDGSFLAGRGVHDALTKLGDLTYQLVRLDQVVYRFDTQGRLTSLRDRNNQGLSFVYAGGLLTQITDSVGRQITLSYNNNLLAQLSLPDGRSVAYGYTNGLLTAVTDLRGGITQYIYDANSRLKKIVDQNLHTVVDNTYDADGRVIQQIDGRGNPSTFSWDPVSQVSTFTDARGKAWKDAYASGHLVQRTDPLGNTTQYGYDKQLNLVSLTDARGNTTSFTYDDRANLLTRTDPAPLSYQTVYAYFANNDLKSVTDSRGNPTTYDYDTTANLVKITQPGTVITTFGRDPAGTGLLTSVTDPNNKTTNFGYDTKGNLISVTNPLGNKTTMGYDSSGRMTTRVDPRGNVKGAKPADFTWAFTYDNADHLRTQKAPLPNMTEFTYDGAGSILTRKDANNHVTTYAYDQDNNLTSVTAPDPTIVTSYGYDLNNNLAIRTDANNHTTTYAYDDANRLSSMTSPMGKTWSFGYDPNGNLATKTLPQGSITYAYDVLNLLTGITYSDAPTTPNVAFGYDGNGNRTSMTDGAGSVSYTYDPLNRLSLVTRGADTFGYGYDPAGNVNRRTYPDSTVVTYTYDGANRLATAKVGTATTTYGYDTASNLASITLPNTVKATLTYDRAGRLTSIANKKGNKAISSFTYTLDPVGNPKTVVTPSETITYTYDLLDRLTEACYLTNCSGTGLAGIEYTYDGVGNRLTETRDGSTPSATTYSYNVDDQLTSTTGPAGTTTYGYDPNGNETQAGSRTFAFDRENRLISTTDAGVTEAYGYDGDGNRLTLSQSGTVQTRYLWDANNPLALLALERDSGGALLRRYVNGQGPISMTTGGSDHYFLTDVLGSVVNLTDASGAKEWSFTYEPYGTVRASTKDNPSAPTNLLRFTGQLFDPTTSLYDLRARQYDPGTGRFLEQDPLVGPRVEPFSSQYVYVRDRATVATDPSGLWCLIHNSSGGCLGGSVVHSALHVARFARNAPFTAGGYVWAEANGGDCHWQPGLIVVCASVNSWSNGPRPILTIGNTVIAEGAPTAAELTHEIRHADQWAIFGPLLPGLYSANEGVSQILGRGSCLNFFEWWAGFEEGNYSECMGDIGSAGK